MIAAAAAGEKFNDHQKELLMKSVRLLFHAVRSEWKDIKKTLYQSQHTRSRGQTRALSPQFRWEQIKELVKNPAVATALATGSPRKLHLSITTSGFAGFTPGCLDGAENRVDVDPASPARKRPRTDARTPLSPTNHR